MTFRYIEVFLALARTPNMREVASRLYISQAAVSSSLRGLESELGIQLFDRVGRGMRLNEKGRLLAAQLAPLYLQLSDSLSLAVSNEMSGNLRLGASTTLADFVLPQMLYDFKMKHRLVYMSFKSASTKDIVLGVEDGSLDLGFVEGEAQSLKLQSTPLRQERLVVVTSDWKFAQDGPYTLAQLMDAKWLLRQEGSGTRETFLSHAQRMGLMPNIFLEFSDNDAIKSVLRNRGTLACISPLVVATEIRRREFFIVTVQDADFSRTFLRIMHRDKPLSPLLQRFCQTVADGLERTTADSKYGDWGH